MTWTEFYIWIDIQRQGLKVRRKRARVPSSEHYLLGYGHALRDVARYLERRSSHA